MTGRPRDSAEAKRLRGSKHVHTPARNDQEIAVPPCPDWLPPVARDEWKRCAGPLAKSGILAGNHAALFGVYCAAVASHREAVEHLAPEGSVYTTETGVQRASAWVKIKNDAEKIILAAAARFGMDPTSLDRMSR